MAGAMVWDLTRIIQAQSVSMISGGTCCIGKVEPACQAKPSRHYSRLLALETALNYHAFDRARKNRRNEGSTPILCGGGGQEFIVSLQGFLSVATNGPEAGLFTDTGTITRRNHLRIGRC